MPLLRETLLIAIAVISLGALSACQSNTAGKPGYVPNTCAAPGSNCTRNTHEMHRHIRPR